MDHGDDVKVRNQRIFDSHVQVYLSRELLPPEHYLLRLLRGRWADVDMLDLGVGAGRTAYTFSAIAGNYVGVDYSSRMIAHCRATIGEHDGARFVAGDCCDLSRFYGRYFDLVVFSFNGIDCNGHQDRIAILAEVKKVLKPNGLFYFSAHNLNVYPFPLRLCQFRAMRPLWSIAKWSRSIVRHFVVRIVNRRVDTRAARERGWAVLCDAEADTWTQPMYYIAPAQQILQCEAAGFDVISVIGVNGIVVRDYETVRDWWLHYLCCPKSIA